MLELLLSMVVEMLMSMGPIAFGIIQYLLCRYREQWGKKLIPVFILAVWAVASAAAYQAGGVIMQYAWLSGLLCVFNAAGDALGWVCYGIYTLYSHFRRP